MKEGIIMKKFFSILVGKLTYLIAGKIFKRGSSLPGVIALKLNKNILYDFKLPKTVIAVTGSSGKGSTTSIMANVYKNLGYKVCYNDKGSNQVSAIITSLLENSKLNGKVKSDVCIFEMDERYAIQVFPKINPSHVVVTNITRDQPPRQGSFEEIYNCILNSLNKECKLILNGDDPYLQYFNLDTKNECYFFGIEKTKYSYFKNDYPSLNISRCPKCNKKLEYTYYHLEQLGDYKCSSCDFKRPKLTSMITSYDYNNSLIVDRLYEETRSKVAKFINAFRSDEILFCDDPGVFQNPRWAITFVCACIQQATIRRAEAIIIFFKFICLVF